MHPLLDAWLQHHRPVAAWLRRPAFDDDPRPDAELDLLVFDADVAEMAVQREPGTPTLDIVRLPAALLAAPGRLAGWGLFAHRLMSAQCVFDLDGRGAAAEAAWTALARTPAAVDARVSALLDTGRLTVREIGVSWDWPALGVFWLQIAQSALLGARLDAAGHWCPNIYTRPLAAARRAEAAGLGRFETPLIETLGLPSSASDGASVAANLQQLHAAVRRACPTEPHWPPAIGPATRQEWRYWHSPAELDERLAAAAALQDRGLAADAVLYLRYTAYSLLRVAMLHQRALEGGEQTVTFLRPEVALYPDLLRHHPALLRWADAILGGADLPALQAALSRTQALHRQALDAMATAGTPPSESRPWAPYREAPAAAA